jgi:hypothetical protein
MLSPFKVLLPEIVCADGWQVLANCTVEVLIFGELFDMIVK